MRLGRTERAVCSKSQTTRDTTTASDEASHKSGPQAVISPLISSSARVTLPRLGGKARDFICISASRPRGSSERRDTEPAITPERVTPASPFDPPRGQ